MISNESEIISIDSNRINNRSYAIGDENQIYELVRAVWGWRLNIPIKHQWIAGWRWIFEHNPAGNSIIWLAEHDGKIIGEYPIIMMNMMIDHRQKKAAQIVDTMTHPKYRCMGVAFNLGCLSLNELIEKKVGLAYGFPTAEVYPLHIKSGWIDVCTVQMMIRPLKLKKILNEYISKNKLLVDLFSIIWDFTFKNFLKLYKSNDELIISEILSFDDRFDNFWERIANDYNIIVARDKKYLNWRYIDAPNSKYTIYAAEKKGMIYGYMVLECKQHNGLIFGYILDIIAGSEQQVTVTCLISKAIEHFFQENADAIVSNIIANKYFFNFLKNGFVPVLGSKSRFIAYNASHEIPDLYLKNSKNWFIQLGDLPFVF